MSDVPFSSHVIYMYPLIPFLLTILPYHFSLLFVVTTLLLFTIPPYHPQLYSSLPFLPFSSLQTSLQLSALSDAAAAYDKTDTARGLSPSQRSPVHTDKDRPLSASPTRAHESRRTTAASVGETLASSSMAAHNHNHRNSSSNSNHRNSNSNSNNSNKNNNNNNYNYHNNDNGKTFSTTGGATTPTTGTRSGSGTVPSTMMIFDWDHHAAATVSGSGSSPGRGAFSPGASAGRRPMSAPPTPTLNPFINAATAATTATTSANATSASTHANAPATFFAANYNTTNNSSALPVISSPAYRPTSAPAHVSKSSPTSHRPPISPQHSPSGPPSTHPFPQPFQPPFASPQVSIHPSLSERIARQKDLAEVATSISPKGTTDARGRLD